jgi:hypothetical protein
MKKTALALLLMCLTGPAGAGEIWTVTEGDDWSLRGTWSVEREGETLSGSAIMYDHDGERVTYFLTGKIENGSYVIERMGARDEQACAYEGASKSDNQIGGSVRCGYKSGPWMAQREKD